MTRTIFIAAESMFRLQLWKGRRGRLGLCRRESLAGGRRGPVGVESRSRLSSGFPFLPGPPPLSLSQFLLLFSLAHSSWITTVASYLVELRLHPCSFFIVIYFTFRTFHPFNMNSSAVFFNVFTELYIHHYSQV